MHYPPSLTHPPLHAGVFEEKLLKGQGYAEVDALEVVGWEGFFGTLLSFFVMLPICAHVAGSDYGNVAENTLGAQIASSEMF
jgi:hypothetical protein